MFRFTKSFAGNLDLLLKKLLKLKCNILGERGIYMPPAKKSKRYRIQDVEPGMIVGKTILADNGRLALYEGTRLTASLIDRLYNRNIYAIDILEETEPQKAAGQPQAQNGKSQAFHAAYQDTVQALKDAYETIATLKVVPVDTVWEIAGTSVWSMAHTAGALSYLHILYQQNEYLLQHSLNVAVIAGILGRWMGFSGQQLHGVILAGLLHDIGKTQIPHEILIKPGKLSDGELAVIRTHPVEGYKLLRKSDLLPLGVLSGVLEHHERLDGTGYPLKLRIEKIHPFAQIVAVADIYDAMTSDRPYRAKLSPFAATDILVHDMFQKLSPAVCTTFLNNLLDHFIGNNVRLSDGREGQIVYLGKTLAQRPVIRTRDGEFIDLAGQPGISIVAMSDLAPAKAD